MRKILLAVVLSLFACGAWAQNAVQQSGSVSPGNVPIWKQDHIIGDSGLAAGSFTPVLRGNAGPFTPTGFTTTASAQMMGLKVTTSSLNLSRLKITTSGQLSNNTTNDGASCQTAYGTGNAPNPGDSQTGITQGPLATYSSFAPNVQTPFTLITYIQPIIPGTIYWIDLACKAVSGGTGSAGQVYVLVEEQ